MCIIYFFTRFRVCFRERVVKSEEVCSERRYIVRDILRGLSLLRESASLGDAESVFALGFYLPNGEVYPGTLDAIRAIANASKMSPNGDAKCDKSSLALAPLRRQSPSCALRPVGHAALTQIQIGD
jgi:hypothetical protein